jgi:hypothetical protein
MYVLTGWPLRRRPNAPNNKILEEEVEKQVEAELIEVGGFGRSKERGIRGLWNRIDADICDEPTVTCIVTTPG